MANKTIYFKNCLGVFQGGGCRAAAYVGAYRTAKERGVTFSAIAGTSAGAIIAALIGAGATVDQLEEVVRRLNFKNFLNTNPEKLNGYTRPWIAPFITPFKKELGKIISYLGIYSSKEIENFMIDELSKIIGTKKRSVKFADLKIPTTIVATDLRTQKANMEYRINS